MRVYVGTELLLSGLSADQVRVLQQRVTYRNPLFDAARRSGRYLGPTKDNPEGIRETMRLWRTEDSPDGVALVLPRGLLSEVEDRLRPELRDLRICPRLNTPISLAVTLRDYQQDAVSTIEEAEQGVIQAPTGSGKTVIAMGLIAALQTPTLFVVHTRVLLDQTAASMRSMLGVSPGVVGDGKCSLQDVTVAMVQTLMRMDAVTLRGLTRRFGLVILDEAHHCPAASFRDVVSSFPARYRVGLTATPTRKDGMQAMLFDTIGPVVYQVAPERLIDAGAIVPAEVVRVSTGWTPRAVPTQRQSITQVRRIEAQTGKPAKATVDYGALLALLVTDPERNQLVLDTIVDLHAERSLVLTERVEHAKSLATAISGRGLPAKAMTGNTAQGERSEVLGRLKAGTLPVLVSTPQLVGEGFDLPTIDTVFLAAPNGNTAKTTQILGRVLRPAKGKDRGRIVDFIDDSVPTLRAHAAARSRVYRIFEKAQAGRIL